MAYRRPQRRYRRFVRRRRAAIRKRAAPRARIPRMTMRNKSTSQLIAPRYITKLKYSERLLTGSPAAAALASAYLMNLNSIFDPDRTGGGHQPMGRDQLSLIYHRYRVFAVSWRIEFFASLSNTTFFVIPKNDSVSVSGYGLSAIKETPHAFSKLSSIDKPTVFSGHVSLPRLTGQTPAQYKAGLEYQALYNGDPTELMTLQVGHVPVNNTFSHPFDITMIYHVELFDPIPLGQS